MYLKSNVYLNEFANNLKTYTSYQDITEIWTNMYIKSVDRFILKSYINHLCETTLKMNVEKTLVKIKENTYNIHKDIFKVDLRYVNDYNIFVDYLRDIVSKKPLYRSHKLVILENIDCISQNRHILSILSSSIDKNYAYFILTGKREIKNDLLNSRFLTVRLPVFTYQELLYFCKVNNVEISDKELKKIQQNANSLYHILLNLQVNSNKLIIDDVDKLLKNILKSVSSNSSSIIQYLQSVRDGIYKLQSYNIKKDFICKRLIHTILKLYSKRTELIHFAVNQVAELQHKLSHTSSKPMCHFEYFFIAFFERASICISL